MIVGVPREIKTNENRVALVPAGAESLRGDGHTVLVEQGAGLGSGFLDDAYRAVGAAIAAQADDVWAKADLILKVKEPIESEWPRIRKGQVLFTYFHFAAAEVLTQAILKSGCIAIAYETVQLPSGELPLLTPMSEVAGRMAVQEGAKYLEKVFGGSGILLGGVPGVLPAEVLVIGGGVVGTNAAKMAAGLGAHVTLLDVSLDRLRYLSDVLEPNVDLLYSNRHNILEQIQKADVVIYSISTNISKIENDGDKVLTYLSTETGGQAFFPFKVQDLAQSFENIANELRRQYNIFYRPEPLKADGLYHAISLKVVGRKDLVVRARKGYYAPRM